MDFNSIYLILFLATIILDSCFGEQIAMPSFQKMKTYYPGQKHFGGQFSHRKLKDIIGITEKLSLHDTSAIRLSYSLNKIGGRHSLGTELIQLSKSGHDSIGGKNGQQYIFNPIAFGPYLADKYGYPNVSILHQTDPVTTKDRFYGKQGILEIITYTKKGNRPKGHVVLWDCDHIYQAKDWISKHHLITAQFWQSPDSNCTNRNENKPSGETNMVLKPVPFGVARVDTVRYYNSKLQQQKVVTERRKNNIYMKIVYGNNVP